MKAVMWTDVVQISIMFAGMIAIVAKGTYEVGGFDKVWNILENTERIEFFKYQNALHLKQ